jgi:hypothetical protein
MLRQILKNGQQSLKTITKYADKYKKGCIRMKCSVCFFCEKEQEFHFCKCHKLEVFDPDNAGCNDGRRSLTLIIGNIKERIIHQMGDYPASNTHHPSKIATLASQV